MEQPAIGALASHPAVQRHPANPILTWRDVPYPATLPSEVMVLQVP